VRDGTRERSDAVTAPPAAGAPDPTVTSVTVAPMLPAGQLAVRARWFLDAALAGRPIAELLAGDRLLLLTPASFHELLPAAGGGFRGTEVSLEVGCGDSCRVPLEEVLRRLREDLRVGVVAVVTVDGAFAGWPTVEVAAGRRWRLSFDDEGARLVAIELRRAG